MTTRTANDVKLLAGVGLNAYGGVYYEGDSPYSLERHLREHPELVARGEQGTPLICDLGIYGPRRTAHACPPARRTRSSRQESLRWLFETLEVDERAQIESAIPAFAVAHAAAPGVNIPSCISPGKTWR